MSATNPFAGADIEESGRGSLVARNFVRQKVLEVAPTSAADAVIARRLAFAADIGPNTVLPHLAQLSRSGALVRLGAGGPDDPFRYYRPTEEETATENDKGEEGPMGNGGKPRLTAARVLELLPKSADDAITAAEFAALVGEWCSPSSASATLGGLYKRSKVDRVGRGIPGNGYRYFVGTPDVAPKPKPAARKVRKKKAGRRKAAVKKTKARPAPKDSYAAVIGDLEAEAQEHEQAIEVIREAIASVQRVRELGGAA